MRPPGPKNMSELAKPLFLVRRFHSTRSIFSTVALKPTAFSMGWMASAKAPSSG